MPKEIKVGNEIKTMYTTYELAEMFNVTYRTIQRYMSQDKLKDGVIMAGRWYFSEETVKRFLDGQMPHRVRRQPTRK